MKFAIDAIPGLWQYLLRIVVAAACGFAIGYERKTRSKEAGVRTHTIVCMASALMMIVSKYAFSDLLAMFPEKSVNAINVDASRIASQIVSGMGFLGAGIIYYRRDLVKGLTTAAGIWAAAGVGMAIGAGMVVTGAVVTVVIIVLQIVLHRPFKFLRTRTFTVIKMTVLIESPSVIDKIQYLFGTKKILRFKTTTNADGIVQADVELTTDKILTEKEIFEITNENTFIKSLEKTDEI